MTASGKTLYLVRHAKSSWDDAGLPDRERPLNKRGRRNAPEMGRRLADQGHRPDLIVSSPAVRAHATAIAIATALGMEAGGIQVEPDFYFKGTRGMLRAIERVDDSHASVMVVGHNPTMTDLFNRLCRAGVWNMPTCAIGIVTFDMPSWGLIDSTDGKLLGYDTPKGSGEFDHADLP